MKMGFLLLLLFLIYGCCFGDLKRRDFWDWLFGVGLMLSLGLVSKKLHFWLGLTGPAEPGGGRFGPQKKKIHLVNGLGPGRGS